MQCLACPKHAVDASACLSESSHPEDSHQPLSSGLDLLSIPPAASWACFTSGNRPLPHITQKSGVNASPGQIRRPLWLP